MKDAKNKKTQWKVKLQQLAVEAQWMLREGLLAKGAIMMMVLEENQKNAAECKSLVSPSHTPLHLSSSLFLADWA